MTAAGALALHAALRPESLKVGSGMLPIAQSRLPGAADSLPNDVAPGVPRLLAVLLAVEVLMACVAATVIAWRAPRSSSARSLAGFLSALTFAWAFMWFAIPLESVLGKFELAGAGIALTAMVAAGAAFVQFTSRFPHPLTDADVLRGPPPGPIGRSARRAVEALGRFFAPGSRGPESTVGHPSMVGRLVDAAILAGALTALTLYLLRLETYTEDAAVALRIQTNVLRAADTLLVGTWAALLTVVIGPVVRRAVREWPVSRKVPTGLRLLAITIAWCVVLALGGDIGWAEALTLISAAVLLARAGPGDLDAAGRRLDWWLALGVLAARVLGLTYVAHSDDRATAVATLGTAIFIWAIGRLAQRAATVIVRLLGRALLGGTPVQSSRAEPAGAALSRVGTGSILRCLLLRPAFLWGLVLLTGVGLVAGERLVRVLWATYVAGGFFTGAILAGVGLFLVPAIPLTVAAALMVRGAAQLRLGYALADEDTRRKALWLVVGLNAAVALLFAGLLAPILMVELPSAIQDRLKQVTFLTVFPLTVLSVAFVVFYHGALDPRLVLRATSLYALLGVVGVVAYAGIENLLAEGLTAWLGLPEAAGPWVAGGAVALTMGSLRTRLSVVVAGAIGRAFPAVVLSEGAAATAAVAAVDIADDHAVEPSAVRLAMRRAKLLQSAARTAARRHGGRVATASRDMIIMEFDDSAGAIAGVGAVRAEYERRCARGRVPAVPLRTGLHVGSVLRDADGALFGPVVDVADDLRRSAPPGCVLMSETIVRLAGADAIAATWGQSPTPGGGQRLVTFRLAQTEPG